MRQTITTDRPAKQTPTERPDRRPPQREDREAIAGDDDITDDELDELEDEEENIDEADEDEP